MRWVLPAWCLQPMARSQELLLLFAIAWGVAPGCALGGWPPSFSQAGAFRPASHWPRHRTGGDERPADRHPGLLLLFSSSTWAPGWAVDLGAELVPAVVLSLFVLILATPLIVMAYWAGWATRKRTGL